ncbi:MAG: SgcJ/EcaC family oxidoreductase [Rubrivivax sp.]|nr:MAG: SgcJ/EcaC family oxidoreductase [Rubrivivax sp.]
MDNDESQIRELIATWHAATLSKDVGAVLRLMTDDMVFLVPGRPPMDKTEFAAISRQQAAASAPTIHATSDIREIQIAGDWAFMWTVLSVEVTPTEGGQPTHRAGHTLSVLKKQNGQWLLARDANLLVTVPQRLSSSSEPTP